MAAQVQHASVDVAQRQVAPRDNGSFLRYLIRLGHASNCEAEIANELQIRRPKDESEADPDGR